MQITAIKPIVARFGNRPRVLVKVETDEGISGWGEAYSIGPDLSVGPVVDYCFELIKGIDPRRIEFIMMKLTQQFRFPPGGVQQLLLRSSLQDRILTPSPQSHSFSRSYGTILPTSLSHLTLSTRGC